MVVQNTLRVEPDRLLAQPRNEGAYHVIERDITRCQLPPARQVTGVALAAPYGVSRAAVRTSLNRPYHERLMQPMPRQGDLIAPITQHSAVNQSHRRFVTPAAPAVVPHPYRKAQL